jgi:hypothetical protein
MYPPPILKEKVDRDKQKEKIQKEMNPMFRWAVGAKPGLEPDSKKGVWVRPAKEGGKVYLGTDASGSSYSGEADDVVPWKLKLSGKKKGKKGKGGKEEGGEEVVERLLLKWTDVEAAESPVDRPSDDG